MYVRVLPQTNTLNFKLETHNCIHTYRKPLSFIRRAPRRHIHGYFLTHTLTHTHSHTHTAITHSAVLLCGGLAIFSKLQTTGGKPNNQQFPPWYQSKLSSRSSIDFPVKVQGREKVFIFFFLYFFFPLVTTWEVNNNDGSTSGQCHPEFGNSEAFFFWEKLDEMTKYRDSERGQTERRLCPSFLLRSAET